MSEERISRKKKRTPEEKYAALMAKIPDFRLMDDTFMTAFFDGQLECAEFVLRIILEKEDLKVVSCVTQREIHSVSNRSTRLDVYAIDSNGKYYDIEVQNSDDGADVKRARFNSSMMDTTFLKKKSEYKELPETYVIFITENDVLNGEKPIYHIDRKISELENRIFGDESHIIYVNGSYKSDDALGKLIADFQCKNPKKMNYKILSERADYLKSNGGSGMCKIMDDLVREERAEERAERNEEIAIKLLKNSKMTNMEISLMTDMTLQDVEELAKEIRGTERD